MKNFVILPNRNLWPYYNSLIVAAVLYICSLFYICSIAQAADLPGSSDPSEIKRYEGTEIIRYENSAFDKYILPLGKMVKFDFGTKVAEFEKSEVLEGQITRISYRLADPQRSSLEIARNYENSLVNAGWEVEYKASGKQEYGNAFTHVYESLRDNDQLFTYNDSQGHLLVIRQPNSGLSAVIFVTKFEQGLSRGIKINKNDPIIQLDLIRTKQMDQKMVLVTSSKMAESIKDTGKVSLYGILFDFNKAEIKAESEPTLQEISRLLREDASLKLLVVGHTDSVGDFEVNRDLSQRRATSVVTALKDKHGISADRLSSFGASYAAPVASNTTEEGRAKNRRVELVRIEK